MNRIAILTGAALLGLAVPATAQTAPSSGSAVGQPAGTTSGQPTGTLPGDNPNDMSRTTTREVGDATQGVSAAPPSDWRGTQDEWRAHSQRCMAMYKSYDARTNMYTDTSGRKTACKPRG